MKRAAWATAACLLLSGCREDPPAPTSEPPEANRDAAAEPPQGTGARFDLLEHLHGCDIRHRGLSLDLGSRAALVHRGYAVGPFDDLKDVEREGTTFAQTFTKRLTFEFWLDRPQDTVFVSTRLRGILASRVGTYIDGKRVGISKLKRGEVTTTRTREIERQLDEGRHRLELRFNGRQSSPPEPYAEIDWVRIAGRDEQTTTYAAPTLDSIVVDIPLADRPKRSLALRAHSVVRCALSPGRGTRLDLAAGFWGQGKGELEIRIRKDGQEPVVALQKKVSGGRGAMWSPLSVDLSEHADELIGLELVATRSTRGGRVVFGEPAVVTGDFDAEPTPPAKTVVVVVAASADRRDVPPWGPIGELAALGELARTGAAFNMYRAPTTVPAGVFASMVTGQSPRAHSLEDPSARLPNEVASVVELVKQASVRTAMFTSVPTSFEAFGFKRGWDVFESFSPVDDVPATEPFDRAAKWLEKDLATAGGRRFVVVYARGGHPPWDITPSKAEALPPDEYGGGLDPRRGGIILSKIRSRRYRIHRKIRAEDSQRARALSHATLVEQGRALGRLFDTLRNGGAWDDSLIVFVGDVGPGDPPSVPHDPAGDLTEDRLIAPLVVRFPGRRLAAKSVDTAVTSMDLTQTILEGLGVDAPDVMVGVSLFRLALGQGPLGGRPLIATLGNGYSTRWGEWLLRGDYRRRPKLCQVSVDPACVDDVLHAHPIVGRALWQWTHDGEYDARLRFGTRPRRVAAPIDPATDAALEVWGK